VLPGWHEFVHAGGETLVVVAFEQMDQLVDNDILQAKCWLLDVEPGARGEQEK
jgi:hypothetical protein